MNLPLASIFLLTLIGCATGAPPNSLERQAYYITTNWVPEVQGQIVLSNNVITGTNYVTGLVARPHFEPRQEVKAVLETGGTVGTALGQVWVAPLMGLLWGAYTWWAEKRNSDKKKAMVIFGQNIETYSEVTKAQPGGVILDAKVKEEIKAQQVDAGVKKMAAEVHDENVNTVDAKESAERAMRPENHSEPYIVPKKKPV